MGWTRGRVLGRGSTATVSTATITATGEVFAVKSVVLSQSETLQREQQFLSILSSPFVVRYKGCELTKEDNKLMYNLLMQYVPEGTITDAIGRRAQDRLTEAEISHYTRQILRGLEYIHSIGIVHCDIKGANLLVGKGVKIADFGCAKWVGDDVAVRGTPMFMAPEVARGEEQGFAADIWAVGCVVIEMATGGGSPWPNADDPVSVLYKIAFSGESPEIPDVFSRQANDFLRKCLTQDPKQRWGATELLKHPFLRRINRHTQKIVGEDFSRGSPTSILDRDVWGSIEESVSVGTNLSQPTCSSNSLRQRIKRLAGNPDKEQGDCDGEIDWMMIRSNRESGDLEG